MPVGVQANDRAAERVPNEDKPTCRNGGGNSMQIVDKVVGRTRRRCRTTRAPAGSVVAPNRRARRNPRLDGLPPLARRTEAGLEDHAHVPGPLGDRGQGPTPDLDQLLRHTHSPCAWIVGRVPYRATRHEETFANTD